MNNGLMDELLTILESLLDKCRHEAATAEERLHQAEDKEHAVKLVLDMLKETK